VVGPAEVAQEAWLPEVWGGAAGNDEAAALAVRHHDYMRIWMQKDPGSFEPIYECGGNWTAEAWCEGFMAGMNMAADAWAPLRAQQPALLVPFQVPLNAAKVPQAVIRINEFFHTPRRRWRRLAATILALAAAARNSRSAAALKPGSRSSSTRCTCRRHAATCRGHCLTAYSRQTAP